MILAMNTLKMVFIWIVSIVFLFTKKLGALAKQKLHKLPSDIIIYTPEDELETQYIFYIILSSWSFVCEKQHELLEIFFKNKCFWILKIQSEVT